MTALDDHPTLAEAVLANCPPVTGRLVVLDLDDPRVVRAITEAIDCSSPSVAPGTVVARLAILAEPVTPGDPITRGHTEDGSWVGHTWPVYVGPMNEA